MKSAQFKFSLSELNLDISEIKTLLVKPEDGNQELVSGLIEDVLREIKGIPDIKGEYVVFHNVKFDNKDNSLEFANIKFNLNRLIYKEISKSESIVVFLCTAGKEISIVSHKMMNEGDFLKGYIYDIIGSAIVDTVADFLQDKLTETMKREGLALTNRYSPGHCKWDVSEQKMLFRPDAG